MVNLVIRVEDLRFRALADTSSSGVKRDITGRFVGCLELAPLLAKLARGASSDVGGMVALPLAILFAK